MAVAVYSNIHILHIITTTMTQIINLYHFNTDTLRADENICATNIDSALKKYRSLHPITNITEIKLEKKSVIL